MSDALRQELAARSKTIVVKVGTRVLAHEDGTLDQSRVAAIAEQIVHLMTEKRQVVLVSSGAVGAGIGRLGLTRRPTDLAQLQAVAAIGQSRLIESYNRALEGHGRHAAQILLTADDLNDRTRYLNVRNTLLTIFQYGALPIVNENDTVRVDELQRNVGDNDRLAAMVTNLLRAPLLVLLSDVEGLYDRHPAEAGATVIPQVDDLDAAIAKFLSQTSVISGPNNLSRGGMASKLEAARLAVTAGESVIIANGRRPNVLVDVVSGANVGTLFATNARSVPSWKRWLGLTAQPNGKLMLDPVARRAVEEQGRSLLAIGIRKSEGEFQKGDIVSICAENGDEFARGLCNYGSDELKRIAGQSSERIIEILGYRPYEEVVHRDNLAILS
jgi:glutamate 5-kinase